MTVNFHILKQSGFADYLEGKGKGNWGHAGRKGKIGGSASGKGGRSSKEAAVGRESAPIRSDLKEIYDVVELGDEDPSNYSNLEKAGQKWLSGLSSKQQAALSYYRDQAGFVSINKALRDGNLSHLSSKQRGIIGDLEESLEGSTIASGTKLYRGMTVTSSSFSSIGLKQGAVFQDDAFMSASPSSSIAANFSVPKRGQTGVLFELKSPRALPGLYISRQGKEPEVLLSRSRRIGITSVTKLHDNIYHVRGELT